MFKKISLIILSLCLLTAESFAMVSFKVENVKHIDKLMLKDELMLITDKKEDFIVLYNKKREVIYYKHKNLAPTFKVSLLKIKDEEFSPAVYKEKSELVFENYKSKLHSLKIARTQCLQAYGSNDLYGALGSKSGFSSMYALYRGFVYMTGVGQDKSKCANLKPSTYLDRSIGFPLVIFYKEKQFKLVDMANEKTSVEEYLYSKGLDMQRAVAPSLDLQYEMMFSLLTEEQQKIFLQTSANKSIGVKIRAISNLLKGF